jgi:hypothetical protein
MYDCDYEKLRKEVKGHAAELSALNYDHFNVLSDEGLALKEQLNEMMKNLLNAALCMNYTLSDISTFIDLKFSSPPRSKAPPAKKAVLTPWDIKI